MTTEFKVVFSLFF